MLIDLLYFWINFKFVVFFYNLFLDTQTKNAFHCAFVFLHVTIQHYVYNIQHPQKNKYLHHMSLIYTQKNTLVLVTSTPYDANVDSLFDRPTYKWQHPYYIKHQSVCSLSQSRPWQGQGGTCWLKCRRPLSSLVDIQIIGLYMH